MNSNLELLVINWFYYFLFFHWLITVKSERTLQFYKKWKTGESAKVNHRLWFAFYSSIGLIGFKTLQSKVLLNVTSSRGKSFHDFFIYSAMLYLAHNLISVLCTQCMSCLRHTLSYSCWGKATMKALLPFSKHSLNRWATCIGQKHIKCLVSIWKAPVFPIICNILTYMELQDFWWQRHSSYLLF